MTTSSWTAGSELQTLDLFWPFHHCHVSPGTLTSLGLPRLHMQGHQEATFNSRKKQRESKHTLTSPISNLDLRIPSSDPGMMAHACHSNNWRVQELETGASDIQAHPWLHREI